MKRLARTRRRKLGTVAVLALVSAAALWGCQATAGHDPGVAVDEARTSDSGSPIVVHGEVTSVLSNGDLTINTAFSEWLRVRVEPSSGDALYPRGHTPQVGDDLWARGYWQRFGGASTFVATLLDLNVERWKGVISPTAGGEGEYTLVEAAKGVARIIVIEPGNLTHHALDGGRVATAEEFAHLPPAQGST